VVVRTTAHIGWFIGDGAGARARFDAVLPHLTGLRLTLLTTGPVGPAPRGADVVELPVGALAAAPGGPARRERTRLRAWLAGDRPDLLVVDGCGEVAATARASSVPTVRMRRPGTTSARVTGVIEAVGTGELAPYPAVLEPASTPTWMRERTVHAGWLSRFTGRRPHRRAGRRALGIDPEARVVTAVCGGEGLGCAAGIAAAADATPRWTWVTVGRCGSPATGLPTNLIRLGWRDDPWAALEAADVVVGSGALSVVGEVASADRPYVVVPRPGRADDDAHARLLDGAEAAVRVPGWPAPREWAAVLEQGLELGAHALAGLDDGRGPARSADWLRSWAFAPGPAGRSESPVTDAGGSPSSGTVLDLTEMRSLRSTVR
jgi:UDP-N-acetylglucosamine--N-acetylmuramyl-(pentapeptide) pyrophosphoryl-undecaprenol N-acetylglucosamine transferase